MARPPVAEASASGDAFREEVLRAARTFKASWTGLARVLTRVRDEGLWESWGFPTFDAYSTRELHIRKATALKLTRSWSFLDRHERSWKPEAPDARPAPAFEVVEVLAEAEERGALDADEYRSIRDSIWDPDRPVAAVRRELTERFPRPAAEPAPAEVRLGQLARTARRLAEELRVCRGVPASVRTQADDLAAAVESLAVERV
ncbi:MAG TPA: hypothetical protein VFF12_18065 [Myxococcaceae bacterium]|nr:hypothetical protein [Myxococcaceae bacterium]